MNGSHKEGLYGALEEVLKAATEPLHCSELFENPLVRKHAETVNRVSDYLGNMWRKGDVSRVPAPSMPGTRSRWLYAWKGRVIAKPKLSEIAKAAEFSQGKVEKLLSRPSLEITQEGKKIVVTTPHATITIQQN